MGVIIAPGRSMFSQRSRESGDDVFGSSFSESLDASVIELRDGMTRVSLKQEGELRLRVRVQSTSRARLRAAAARVRLALALASDFNAAWLCWRETTHGLQRAVLMRSEAARDDALRLPPIAPHVG